MSKNNQMTCFWDGLLKKLKVTELTQLSGTKTKPNCDAFVKLIKSNNVMTSNVKCNGKALTEQEIKDNMIRIKNIKNINNGYLCSSCDPVLILISQLFSVNIIHDFNESHIEYTNSCAKRTIHIRSDIEHMF